MSSPTFVDPFFAFKFGSFSCYCTYDDSPGFEVINDAQSLEYEGDISSNELIPVVTSSGSNAPLPTILSCKAEADEAKTTRTPRRQKSVRFDEHQLDVPAAKAEEKHVRFHVRYHEDEEHATFAAQSEVSDVAEALPALLHSRSNTWNGVDLKVKGMVTKGPPSSGLALNALPDFTGKWVLARIEGNMEELLVDLGVGFLKRRLGRAVNYGIGAFREEISQKGSERLLVSSVTPICTITNNYRIDGSEQDAKDPEGAAVSVASRWVGNKIHCVVHQKVHACCSFSSYRSMHAGAMHVETHSPSGKIVLMEFQLTAPRS